MEKSLRDRDANVEGEIARFLDDKLYSPKMTDFKRFSDKETQMKGIDVQFGYGTQANMLVDEKAMSHYVNKDLPTFAFELSFMTSAKAVVPGWLLDPQKLNEYYALIWPFAKANEDVTYGSITRLDYMLVERKKILHYLSQHGYDAVSLNRKADEIRKAGISGAIGKQDNPNLYFYYTVHLVEKPINIVLRKTVLAGLATARFDIRP